MPHRTLTLTHYPRRPGWTGLVLNSSRHIFNSIDSQPVGCDWFLGVAATDPFTAKTWAQSFVGAFWTGHPSNLWQIPIFAHSWRPNLQTEIWSLIYESHEAIGDVLGIQTTHVTIEAIPPQIVTGIPVENFSAFIQRKLDEYNTDTLDRLPQTNSVRFLHHLEHEASGASTALLNGNRIAIYREPSDSIEMAAGRDGFWSDWYFSREDARRSLTPEISQSTKDLFQKYQNAKRRMQNR